MKLYSALVKDGNRVVVIKNQDYRTKAEFIHDLRHNGYAVNPRKVKPADVFDYIVEHTNMAPEDWDLRDIPGDTVLTFSELIKLAQRHYSEGGDGIVECWDENTFNSYISMFGPITRKTALQLIGLRVDY